MSKYFFIFIMLISFSAFAGEPKIKIELENKDNNLRLYLINYELHDVLINTRFSLKRYPSSPPEVQFEIVNKEGEKFPFDGFLLNETDLGEDNIVLLKYRHIVGYDFHITYLMSCYYLHAGIYKARVTYENTRWADKGVYIGRLTSNWVTFEVTEALINKIRNKAESYIIKPNSKQ